MRAKHAIGENERRRAHSGNTDAFATKIANGVDLSVDRRLHAQTAAMNSAGKFDIEALLDRLEKIHYQVVRYVEPAEREHVLVIRPFAFHQLNVEPFLFEKSVLNRAENRRFARDADVADADGIGKTGR